MIKLIIAVRFLDDGRSRDDIYRYWEDHHAPVAAKVPEQVRYVQNHLIGRRLVDNVELDGVAELWFEDEASMDRALASPEWAETFADAATFVDFGRSVATVAREVQVV
jgi:uncharacterized protein (TIGR02118 family)